MYERKEIEESPWHEPRRQGFIVPQLGGNERRVLKLDAVANLGAPDGTIARGGEGLGLLTRL
jgi:hypothetical protein